MSTKVDLRVIKTMKNIRESFISLLEQKQFCDITVQNILDTALINRTTFYKYYKDKYDLAEQLSIEFLDLSRNYLNERFHDATTNDPVFVANKIYTHLLAQKSFVLGLWTIETETVHVRKDFEALIKEHCKLYLLKSSPVLIADYYSTLYSSIILATIDWLFIHEDVAIDEIVEELKKVFAPILSY